MSIEGQSGELVISQKVVFHFFKFFGILIEHVRVHLHTKNHFGDCIIWRGVSYLVFKKPCFFDVPRNHKVYTRDLYLYGIYNERIN